MSRSHEPLAPGEPSEAHLQLSEMMKRGRSWSGRERNCAYLNLGPDKEGRLARFANVSAVSGTDFPEDGRSVCLTDWDHDGDLDFWISNRTAPQLRFLRNDNASGHHFVALKLTGKTGNRDAIGARVEVHLPGREVPLLKTVRAGDGYLAQSSKWLLFGLETVSEDVRVVVRWPGGAEQVIEKLPVDAHYLLGEGGEAQPWKRSGEALALAPAAVELPASTSTARIPMVTLLRLPPLQYRSFDGKDQPLRAKKGGSLLINLWASWCAPCLAELREFKEHAAELQAAGVEVIGLALDGVGEDRTDPAQAASTAAKLQLPFATGRATVQILTILERLHARLTAMELELVVPMSLLIDKEGRLAVLYKGAPGVEQIIADLSHSSKARSERMAVSAGLKGIALEEKHPTVAKAMDQHEVSQRFQFAQDMWQGRFLDAAVVQFRETLALAPDFAEASNNLGLVLATGGRHEEAVATYQEALKIRPGMALLHFNLGISLDALERPLEARRHFLRALEIDPALPKANDALGLLHAKQGELELARQYFQAETEVNPTFAEGHNHLGLIHLSLNLPRDAVAPLQKATELDPKHADAHNNLGLAYKRLGETGHSADAFRAAVEAAPQYVPAIINLGVYHLDRGDLQIAEQLLVQALTIEPGNPLAQRNLEKVRSLLGK